MGSSTRSGWKTSFDLPSTSCRIFFGEMLDRHLDRIAEIDRAGEIVRCVVHQAQPAIDQVVDVAERAGLHAVAVNGNVLTLERLDDEVRDHAAVIGMHARPVGVEDAYHLDPEL